MKKKITFIEFFIAFCFVSTLTLAGFQIYYVCKYMNNPAEIGKFIKEISRGYNEN